VPIQKRLERKLNKQLGKRGYSLKIGDTWYSYDWAQPVSVPLAIGADAFESGMTEEDFTKKLSSGITAGAGTIFEQSLFRGIRNLFGGQYGTPAEGLLETLTLNAPTQFIPTASSQAAQFGDEFKREVDWKNLGDLLKRKIPGQRETLPTLLDMFGEPVKEQDGRQGLEKLFDVFANPSLKTKETDDPTTQEISRLFQAVGETDVIPSKMPAGIKDDKELSRQFAIEFGQGIKVKLDTLFATEAYQNASDEAKATRVIKEINKMLKITKDKLDI